ncbi:MAG: DNA helicase RecQ [Phycisphaerales bacterium]|nr:DNA helicase RecQ [Phycisphaerales bacterium]
MPGSLDDILGVVRHYWGYDTLRPLQEEAIEAGLAGHDSLVVLPTGGGKSLCYQVPPLLGERMDVVVSPLIALMKDQVDGLVANGYPAAAFHSGLDAQQRQEARELVRSGRCRLLFVSPERLVSPSFLAFVEECGVSSFAIDEAHCISEWGHDFRPEYRQLAVLRERFPHASLHAYTATATPRVRQDIVQQLRLRDPRIIVGTFDRPNLVYRIVPRVERFRQTLDVLTRHPGEAAIVYCISRRETEDLAVRLRERGLRAAHYHAGMLPEARRETQERFADERLDIVTATVAFGMGIDRSDVRCVLHTGIPKSVEAYQQETGRAGRDGLAAECVLLYSYADVERWESLLERGHLDARDRVGPDADAIAQLETAHAAQRTLLRQMAGLASNARCRHAALSEHFGQAFPHATCGACDVCLGEVDGLPDATVVAQKILSCVARVEQRFGLGHVADVLAGADTENVRRLGHERLSTYGLLRDLPKNALLNLMHQLLEQGLLVRSDGDRPIVHLNDASIEVMRGSREVVLLRPIKAGRTRQAKVEESGWQGVDRDLFEAMRALRRDIAEAKGVPPYVVFGDVTLRELAARRPSTLEAMAGIKGIGKRKLADYGPRFLEVILEQAHTSGLGLDAE